MSEASFHEPTIETPKHTYTYDAFDEDWPMSQGFHEVAGDIVEATLNFTDHQPLEELTILRIGSASDGAYVYPRILRDHQEEFKWFEENGYFKLNKEKWEIEITQKWKDKFTKTN